MNVIIVGGGNRVYFLCRTFISKGHTVTVVDRNREDCERFARRLKATVVHGDGSDPSVLEDAGARSAAAVLAVTPNDQDNLVICQLAASRFGVRRTVALVNDPDNEEIFKSLGITAFSVTPAIAGLIEQHASLDGITALASVAKGKVNVTEIVIERGAPVAGKLLRDLTLPENCLVAVVVRGEEAIVPRGLTRLDAGDRIVLVTLSENHGPAIRAITGEKP